MYNPIVYTLYKCTQLLWKYIKCVYFTFNFPTSILKKINFDCNMYHLFQTWSKTFLYRWNEMKMSVYLFLAGNHCN